MTSTSRSLQLSWSTPWATPPPQKCSTLINVGSTVNWGSTCIFPEEDSDTSTLFPLDTACLPWLSAGTPTASNAFFSPATACPTSWSAVATQTSGSGQWVDGETALACCPNGFEDGGSGMCTPAPTGTFAVIECGEADEEENESRTYSGGSWPTRATVNIPALQLRFQESDVEGSSATRSGSTPSSTGSTGDDGGGLSIGAKAAIGTVVPLAVIIVVLAAFLLWRRRRNKKFAAMQEHPVAEAKGYHDSKPGTLETYDENAQSPKGPVVTGSNETPEWNTELDATDAERQREPASTGNAVSAPASNAAHGNVSELGGMARRPRKPVPAVEIDGTPVVSEMDVSQYMAYQPPRERQ